jgi:hypothetical protein
MKLAFLIITFALVFDNVESESESGEDEVYEDDGYEDEGSDGEGIIYYRLLILIKLT